MDNYELVVGSEECPLKTIALIIRKSSVMQTEWSTFARQLDVPNEQIKRLRQDFLIKTFTFEDLIFEVLELWMGNKGSKATLANLLQIVEEPCGANDVGELLRLEYNLPCKEAESNPSIEWKDLSPAFRKRVIQTFQQFTPNLKHEEVLPKLTGAALVRLMKGKKSHVLSLPDKLSYYVSRTIVTRNIISPKIFGIPHYSSDIFLFIGMDRYELSVLARKRQTDTGCSRQQLHSMSYKVKFLILDKESHFEEICRKTKHPVHLLKKEEDGKLRWIKSRGAMHNLRSYIAQEQYELDEEQFCRICDSQSIPVLIYEIPGMGKSVFLGHIGHKLAQLYPDRSVLFIELSELTKLAKSFETEDKLKRIELTLQSCTGDAFAQPKMNSSEETISIELLLDGYDEVDSADRALALEILYIITKSYKYIRPWITSQPHLMNALEINLNALGYNIRPFHEENQIHFLSSFWSRKVQLDQEKVKLFAKHCLNSLKATMSPFDNDIPLQGLLIGEIYEDDAMEYAKVGKEKASSPAPEIKIGTITNLYRQWVKIKFQKYESAFGNGKMSEDDLMTIHSHLSLEILFPLEHEDLGFRKAAACEIEIDEVMKGGILTTTCMGVVTFIHRTFAEYFVAWFLFDKLQQEEMWAIELIHTFFIILECHTRPPFFTHPVICYFLNSMIASLQIGTLPNNFPADLDNWQLSNIQMIASACIKCEFVQIFKLFDERRLFDKPPDKVFNTELLLLTLRNSGVELINLVLTGFERHHKFDLEVQKATVYEAVKRGNIPILEFLIKEKRLRGIVWISTDYTNLVCVCIANTINCSEEEIKEKILVLQMLVEIKGSLVDGPSPNASPETRSFVSTLTQEFSIQLVAKEYRISGTTPLFSKDVHLELIIELIRLGADVFAQNKYDENTILHTESEVYKYYHDEVRQEDYHKLLMSIPTDLLRKLVNVKNSRNYTPLTTLLGSFDPLPETLDIFHEVGADFNHVDEFGYSTLAVAIENGRNVQTIRKLVDLGAEFKSPFTNIFHFAATFFNVSADILEYFLELGGSDANEIDSDGNTPLHCAIIHRNNAARIGSLEKYCRLIIQYGADLNILNNEGCTPLTIAMMHQEKNKSLIELLRPSSLNA